MSKTLLLKQTELTETAIAEKLQVRELCVNLVTEKLYLRLRGGLSHIVSETFMSEYVTQKLETRSLMTVSDSTDPATLIDKSVVFNSTATALQYIHGNSRITLASISQLPLNEPQTVEVSTANIDSVDGSVSLSNFTRPMIMVYIDGILCVPSANATKRYIFNTLTKELKVFGCQDGSVIAYY